jgi:hypothetical protein
MLLHLHSWSEKIYMATSSLASFSTSSFGLPIKWDKSARRGLFLNWHKEVNWKSISWNAQLWDQFPVCLLRRDIIIIYEHPDLGRLQKAMACWTRNPQTACTIPEQSMIKDKQKQQENLWL